MKKFLILFLFFLTACTSYKSSKIDNVSNKNITLPNISTSASSGIFVSVSDSHPFSKTGPKLLSGSYYFDFRKFYIYPVDISIFKYAYSSLFDGQKVYYYDENDGAQAGMVVYILKNIYHKKNVSLLINSNLKKSLKFNEKYKNIPIYVKPSSKLFTGGFVGTGKFLVVYDPKLIHFTSGDLLLYSSDIGTMKFDSFYQNTTGVNIQAFDWSKLITFDGNLKSKKDIEKLLNSLYLEKYKKVYIYYPKFWYRSGILALYFQQYYGNK